MYLLLGKIIFSVATCRMKKINYIFARCGSSSDASISIIPEVSGSIAICTAGSTTIALILSILWPRSRSITGRLPKYVNERYCKIIVFIENNKMFVCFWLMFHLIAPWCTNFIFHCNIYCNISKFISRYFRLSLYAFVVDFMWQSLLFIISEQIQSMFLLSHVF